jgi:hypothetical protein
VTVVAWGGTTLERKATRHISEERRGDAAQERGCVGWRNAGARGDATQERGAAQRRGQGRRWRR